MRFQRGVIALHYYPRGCQCDLVEIMQVKLNVKHNFMILHNVLQITIPFLLIRLHYSNVLKYRLSKKNIKLLINRIFFMTNKLILAVTLALIG